MKWTLYRHPLYNPNLKGNMATVGTLVTIYISEDKKTVKRVYNPQGKTVSNKRPTITSISGMKKLFKNELYWLKKMADSTHVPKLIDYNEKEMQIVQEFAGNDIYTILARKQDLPKDCVSQLYEIYEEYRIKELFKGNGDPRNLGIRNGKILAFDFKWAVKRKKEGVSKEWASICHFLQRIHPNLLVSLRETFNDYPEEKYLLKLK